MIISVRGRTRLAGVILAVGLISSSGCSVSVSGGGGAAGAAPAEGTVEFPETGDALIVTTNPTQGDMTVFGDSATGMVSRIVLTHPNGAMDAEFDGQGRPTRVVLDGSAVFDITYDADGTSSYTLTENGTVISTGRNLTPAGNVDFSTLDLSTKQGTRVQSTELDALLCVPDVIGRWAREACLAVEIPGTDFSGTTLNTQLARQMQSNRTAFRTALGFCSAGLAVERLRIAAEAACRRCEADPQACCLRLGNGNEALENLQDWLDNAIKPTFESALFRDTGSTEEIERLCSDTGDGGPADTGDGDPTPGTGDDQGETPTGDKVACCASTFADESPFCLEPMTAEECLGICGIPSAPGVRCEEVACDNPIVACCVPGLDGCRFRTAECCARDGGTVLPEGGDCGDCP